mmetsp:Transcript_10484/g.19310  ORF Transcript_10484/g.19310 Transcript_10484/m.19310 type:complete len:272 (-) Transcript_10484:583-1398(-)
MLSVICGQYEGDYCFPKHYSIAMVQAYQHVTVRFLEELKRNSSMHHFQGAAVVVAESKLVPRGYQEAIRYAGMSHVMCKGREKGREPGQVIGVFRHATSQKEMTHSLPNICSMDCVVIWVVQVPTLECFKICESLHTRETERLKKSVTLKYGKTSYYQNTFVRQAIDLEYVKIVPFANLRQHFYQRQRTLRNLRFNAFVCSFTIHLFIFVLAFADRPYQGLFHTSVRDRGRHGTRSLMQHGASWWRIGFRKHQWWHSFRTFECKTLKSQNC